MDLAGAPKSPATPSQSCLTFSTAKEKTTNLPQSHERNVLEQSMRTINVHLHHWLTNTPGASSRSIHKPEAAGTAG